MPSDDSRFELRPNGDQDFLSLHANCAFAAAEIVLTFSLSEPQEKPHRYTIQCGRDQHAVLRPEFLRYMNHHYAPNLYLDMQSQCLLCLRDVVRPRIGMLRL